MENYNKLNRMFQDHQNGKINLYKQFQQKLKNIDQVARLAIQAKEKKISQKYGNIQSTAKILKSLVFEFTKKSIKLQEELRETARIQDLQYQTQYHQKRLQECLKLSQNLYNLITNKKNSIQKYESESAKLKQELILAKTDNIKKILKMQMIQNLEQEKIQIQNQQNRLNNLKKKMHQNRTLMQAGLITTPSQLELLKMQKKQLSACLWQKISRKVSISKNLFENYQILKEKLVKQQKKSNVYGLTGSLLFKLQQNKHLTSKIGLSIARKNKSDHKLLIYDVLKQKHSVQIKSQKQQQNQIRIQLDQFLQFTPIQILGLIQLKGGISELRKNKTDIFSGIKTQNITSKNNAKNVSKAK